MVALVPETAAAKATAETAATVRTTEAPPAMESTPGLGLSGKQGQTRQGAGQK
jgi:hypothetical protein